MNKNLNPHNRQFNKQTQNFSNNNNNNKAPMETAVRQLQLKKNGKEFIPNQTGSGPSIIEPIKNTQGLRLLTQLQKRQVPKNDTENNSNAINQKKSDTASEHRSQQEEQSKETSKNFKLTQIDLTNRSLIQKQQNQQKSLIRRTSSSIDEKQRLETQTPTFNAIKNPLPAAQVNKVQMQKNKLDLSIPQKVQTEAKIPLSKTMNENALKPTLNLKQCLQKQQLNKIQSPPQETEKTEQILQSKLASQEETKKNQTQENLSQNFLKLIQPKNPLINQSTSVFSNIINQQHLHQNISSVISKQVIKAPEQPQIKNEEVALLGKRPASSLSLISEENDKEATEKKVKPNAENRFYQDLQQDIIKEMDVEDDSHDESSSSISSNATEIINYESQVVQNEQEQEEFGEKSRKESDLSDDSQKLLSSPETILNTQEMIDREIKRQKKRGEQLQIKNKINENLKLIENKKEKIQKISQIIQQKLSPETLKILKEHIQKQKEILYQTSSNSSKKQNKINQKFLNHMLQNNVQFLQNLKI